MANEQLYELPDGRLVPESEVDWSQFEEESSDGDSWLSSIGKFAGAAAMQGVGGLTRAVTGPAEFIGDITEPLQESTVGRAVLSAIPGLAAFGLQTTDGGSASDFIRDTNDRLDFAQAQQIPETMGLDPQGNAAFYSRIVGQAAPLVAQGVLAPQTIIPSMAQQGFAESYPRLRGAGADIPEATIGAGVDAGINYLGGKFIAPYLKNPDLGIIKRTAGLMAANVPQNIVQDYASLKVQEAATGEDIPLEQEQDAILNSIAGSTVTSGVMGPTLSVAHSMRAKPPPDVIAPEVVAAKALTEGDAPQPRQPTGLVDGSETKRGSLLGPQPQVDEAVNPIAVESARAAQESKVVARDPERGSVINPLSEADNIRNWFDETFIPEGSTKFREKSGLQRRDPPSKGERLLQGRWGEYEFPDKKATKAVRTALIFPKTVADNETNFKPAFETGRNIDKETFATSLELSAKLKPVQALSEQSKTRVMNALTNLEKATDIVIKSGKSQTIPVNDNILRTVYGLSPEEIVAAKSLREMYDSSADIIGRTMKDDLSYMPDSPAKVERLAKIDAFVADLKRRNYISASRFGDHYVHVKDDNGDTVNYQLFNTRAEAKAAALAMKKNSRWGWVDYGKVVKPPEEAYDSLPTDMYARLAQIDDDIELKSGGKLPPRGFTQHFEPKNFIAGKSEDLMRSAASYITGIANWRSHKIASRKFDAALKAIDPNKQPELYAYTKRYIDYMKSRGNEGQAVRKALAVWYLGGNLKSAALNLTQNISTTLPRVGMASYARAWKNMLKMQANPEKFAKQNPELFAAYQEAFKHGQIAEGQYRDVAMMGRGTTKSKVGKIAELSMAPFQFAEKVNRIHALFAGYDLATKKGLSGADALRFAEDIVDETQFVYGKSNRPEIARGPIGAPALVFKMWSGNFIRFLRNQYGREGVMGVAKGLAPITTLAGVTALPLAKQLMDALRGSGIDLSKELRKIMADNEAPERLIDGILYGAPAALTPFSISGSLSMGESLPATGGGWEEFAVSLGGAPAGFLRNQARGIANYAKTGDAARSLEYMTPPAISSMLRAGRIATKGARTADNTPMLLGESPYTPDMFSPTEMVGSALGFQPVDFTKMREQSGYEYMATQVAKDTDGYNWAIANAQFENDPNEANRLTQEALSKGIKPSISAIKTYMKKMHYGKANVGVPKKALSGIREGRALYSNR